MSYELATADCVDFHKGETVHIVLSRGLSFACTASRTLRVWTVTLTGAPVCTQLLAAVLGSEEEARERGDMGAKSFVFEHKGHHWLQFADAPKDLDLGEELTWRWRPKYRGTPPGARELVRRSQRVYRLAGQSIATIVALGGVAAALYAYKARKDRLALEERNLKAIEAAEEKLADEMTPDEFNALRASFIKYHAGPLPSESMDEKRQYDYHWGDHVVKNSNRQELKRLGGILRKLAYDEITRVDNIRHNVHIAK